MNIELERIVDWEYWHGNICFYDEEGNEVAEVELKKVVDGFLEQEEDNKKLFARVM